MAEYEFNPNLDKITERELVPDIYARLSIGASISDPDDDERTVELLPATTSVLELNNKIISILPHFMVENLSKIEVFIKEIKVGNTTILARYASGHYILIKAYLENTMTDVSSLISVSYNGSTTGFGFSVDTPFTNSDILKVYVYKVD